MALRGSVFDIFGTLVDWRSGITDAFRAARVPGELAELADAWRARYRSVLAEVNRGAWPWGNFDELHLATSHDLLDERGVELPVEECRLLVRAWHRLPPWPDVHLGLEAMRRHHVTSALSSRHLALLVTLTRHAGLRFDCLLSAELAHAYKPAPEAYLTATRLGPQGAIPGDPPRRRLEQRRLEQRRLGRRARSPTNQRAATLPTHEGRGGSHDAVPGGLPRVRDHARG
jgi:2-haloacid dehalogenase